MHRSQKLGAAMGIWLIIAFFPLGTGMASRPAVKLEDPPVPLYALTPQTLGQTTRKPAFSPENNIANTTANYSFLALGDSYTVGEGVPANETWPRQLVTQFRKEGNPLAEPYVIAETGWNSFKLRRALDAQAKQLDAMQPWDVVTVMIGVNDQYGHVRLNDFRDNLQWILGRAINLTDSDQNRVVAISIPDYSVTDFVPSRDKATVATQIVWYNNILAQESAAYGVPVVDVTPISRLMGENVSLAAEDGLHPSGEMYRLWLDLIAPYVATILTGLPAEGGALTPREWASVIGGSGAIVGGMTAAVIVVYVFMRRRELNLRRDG